MTSTELVKEPLSGMKSVYGVWSSGSDVKCGQGSGTTRNKRWVEWDNVTLIFDCDNKKIHIENNRINWCQVFNIDLDVCPFPWKFFTIIKGYQLRIENHL